MILKCKLAYSVDVSTDGWVNINQFITGKLHALQVLNHDMVGSPYYSWVLYPVSVDWLASGPRYSYKLYYCISHVNISTINYIIPIVHLVKGSNLANQTWKIRSNHMKNHHSIPRIHHFAWAPKHRKIARRRGQWRRGGSQRCAAEETGPGV